MSGAAEGATVLGPSPAKYAPLPDVPVGTQLKGCWRLVAHMRMGRGGWGRTEQLHIEPSPGVALQATGIFRSSGRERRKAPVVTRWWIDLGDGESQDCDDSRHALEVYRSLHGGQPA